MNSTFMARRCTHIEGSGDILTANPQINASWPVTRHATKVWRYNINIMDKFVLHIIDTQRESISQSVLMLGVIQARLPIRWLGTSGFRTVK